MARDMVRAFDNRGEVMDYNDFKDRVLSIETDEKNIKAFKSILEALKINLEMITELDSRIKALEEKDNA